MILNRCVKASLTSGSIYGNPCEQQYGSTFTDIVADQTYPNLVTALTAVRIRAPGATVVILGYPRVMPDAGVPGCYPAMPISMGDVPSVTHWEETLNRAVEKAAAETGALFIDMWPSSADRDACQSVNQRWIEPLIKPANADPVHPTARVRQRWPGKRRTNSVSTCATATGDLVRLIGCPLPSF